MAPQIQQAWIIDRRGEPKDALSFRTDWPVPSKLAKGEVLVKVQAAALNPVGYKLMRALPNFIARRPIPAEYDLAGIIEDPNDSQFTKGDSVFGLIHTDSATSLKTRQGALQQYARMPAAYLVRRPENITSIEAAGVTLAAETAWQALFGCAGLETGQTVFINGGSSSVGAFAIQIAKAKGATRVVASASGQNEEFVKSLGADEFIDYTKQPLHEYLAQNPPSPKFHIILDAVALEDPSLFTYSPAYLAPGGTFVSCGAIQGLHPFNLVLKTVLAMFWPSWLGGVPRSYRTVRLAHDASGLEALRQLLEEAQIKPVVDSVYEFKDVLSAYERIMTSRAKGKVVVMVDS
ncbi:hypothetical protein IW261DRAFT_1553740 [Armillaria novae-zelandiae]|uniref:Enoyl reductase (ER) domain-containing protein n=1 Tax=Armillaria novae-zelandiae TaxID=153914 RepID=A0AA39U9F8_9AGAR|nr:hypothetical protein IW261DRAFT_1553740 [Armillaria novae-zelandiae]